MTTVMKSARNAAAGQIPGPKDVVHVAAPALNEGAPESFALTFGNHKFLLFKLRKMRTKKRPFDFVKMRQLWNEFRRVSGRRTEWVKCKDRWFELRREKVMEELVTAQLATYQRSRMSKHMIDFDDDIALLSQESKAAETIAIPASEPILLPGECVA
jgi:hypothetical protein